MNDDVGKNESHDANWNLETRPIGQQCVLCIVHVALCVLASVPDCASCCATVHLRGCPCKFDAIGTLRDNGPHSAIGTSAVVVVVVVVVVVAVVAVVVVVVVVVVIDDDKNIALLQLLLLTAKAVIARLSLAVAKKWVGTF